MKNEAREIKLGCRSVFGATPQWWGVGVKGLTSERELRRGEEGTRARAESGGVAAAGGNGGSDLSEAAGVANGCATGRAGVAKVRSVREAERFQLKCQGHFFVNREAAAEAHIQVEEAWTAEFIPSRAAEYGAARTGDSTGRGAGNHGIEISGIEIRASRV